ncbi:probable N-acetyltransferase CML1 [Megalops cyprinoides]|uniref:probable N-acetyltransferase CML1 n=1 Tax=Megalops cyprinoides TaxID=118141 RepID=UPI0018653968|nr:probable N-acetyltransferase CML1 [Megalops cyprinoides]
MTDFQIRMYRDEDQEAAMETFTVAMSEHVPAAFLHMLRQPLTQGALACVFLTVLAVTGSLLPPVLTLALALAACRWFVGHLFSRYIDVCRRGDLGCIREVYMERADACFWVAESRGRVVGTVACLPSRQRPGSLELKRMSVQRNHRGRGVARELCRTVVEFARGRGYREVLLYTSVVQADARRLYERAGYRRAGEAVVPEIPAKLMNFTLIEYRYQLPDGDG